MIIFIQCGNPDTQRSLETFRRFVTSIVPNTVRIPSILTLLSQSWHRCPETSFVQLISRISAFIQKDLLSFEDAAVEEVIHVAITSKKKTNSKIRRAEKTARRITCYRLFPQYNKEILNRFFA